MSINESDIDRCHKIGKKNQSNTKPREVITKFAKYNDHRKAFLNKKKVKVLGSQQRNFLLSWEWKN